MSGAYTIRPISDRTAFTGGREAARFKASWPDTETLLLREVTMLRGRDLVIEADFTETDLRLDGRIRANAHPASDAVRVAFDSMYGALTYATNRFYGWQNNVRAIALGLEALRKVDRYGITKRGEQYAGWKALPPGSGDVASHMTREHALALIDSYTPDEQIGAPLDRKLRYVRAATHPDRHDDDRTLWDKVEQAARVLGVTS